MIDYVIVYCYTLIIKPLTIIGVGVMFFEKKIKF